MAELDAFLREAESRCFRDGTWDCCLFPAAWVERVTGFDPAAPYRGRYSTRLGWLRILKREGGLEAVLTHGAARAGLNETTEPERGDVGVVRLPSGVLMAGVLLGDRWASVGSRGLSAVRAEPIKVWSVPCRI